MTDDDDDIYSDLSCINIVNVVPKVDEEKIKLQNLLEEKEKQLNEIRESKNVLEKEKRTLEENISSLYKTAINELKKKDAIIAELTRQKDSILFRREKRQNLYDTNRNLSNATQIMCNKPSIENDEIISEGAKCKSDSVLSHTQKTSKRETVYTDEIIVKHINKEDSSSDNSSVKCNTKYSGSKLDLPLIIGGERNCGSRSQSSEKNPELINTSHGQRSSRSACNNLGSLRSNNGERSKGERYKDAGRDYCSYHGDRKRQRYDTQEDYRERGERYYSRSSVRSPSPKRSRRENSHQRYYDWKKRNSRSNYSRQPPSDSVRVATQVKSKYSKADRERSLSRTPVKKQKDIKEAIEYVISSPNLKSSELVGRTGIISKLHFRNSAEKKTEIDMFSNNHFPSSKYILDPKDIKVVHNEKNVPVSQLSSVVPSVRMEVERRDEEGIPPPSCKTAKDLSDKDMSVPCDKNCSERTKAQAHRTRNGVHSIITKDQSKSETNSYNDIDSLGNDTKPMTTKIGHKSDGNIRPKEVVDKINYDIISPKTNLSSNDVHNEIPLKEFTLSGKSKNRITCSSKQNSCISEESGQIPNRSTDISMQNIPETLSSETCEGNLATSPIPLLTPPLKATVALKVSPSFEDPAVIKDHKFSYTVFNEQCNFHRPKCKKSIRLSGGSCGNESDVSSKVLHKSDSNLYCNKLDEETSSGKRGVERGELARHVRNPPTTENKSFQKTLAQVKLDTMQECPEANTKKAIDSSSFQSDCSNEKGHLLSSKAKIDSSFVKTSLSTSKTTSNPAEKSFFNISVNFDLNKGKDSVPVKGLQKTLTKSKENLSIIEKVHETVKESIYLNGRAKSKELKSHIKSGEKVGEVFDSVNVEKHCVLSSSSCDRTPLEKHTSDYDATARVASSERDEQIPCKVTSPGFTRERQGTSDKSAKETLRSESDKIGILRTDVQKPKVQRTIIVSKFRRKNANFQDSPTPVMTQVKSNAKQ